MASMSASSGAEGQRAATVVRLTADDLARVRFGAGPAPLAETAMGFAELRHQGRRPVPGGWASQARLAFPAAARPLRDLIPARGLWPAFLDPAVPDLDEGLEIISATSRSWLRYDLAVSWRPPGRPPTWLKALADGDREALATVVGALRAFYLACVAPVWPQIAASFRGEVADRVMVLARGGLGEMFGSLHPDLALRDGSLERAAGLILTERHGQGVRHSLTVLGHGLLNGGPSAGGGRRPGERGQPPSPDSASMPDRARAWNRAAEGP
jgi:hypothetical protein